MSSIKTIMHRCKVWLRNFQNTNRLLTEQPSIYTQEPRYMSIKDNIRSMVVSFSLLPVGALVIAHVDFLSFLSWQGWWGAIIGMLLVETFKFVVNLVVLVDRVTDDRYSRRTNGFQVNLYTTLSEITETLSLQPTRKVNILYYTSIADKTPLPSSSLCTIEVADDWHWFAQMITNAFSTPNELHRIGIDKDFAPFGGVVRSIFGWVEINPRLIEWKNNVLAPGGLIDLADVLAEDEQEQRKDLGE